MLRRPKITIDLDDQTWAKLEWVSGRANKSRQAWLKALLIAGLAGEPDPPAGFGIPREQEDD